MRTPNIRYICIIAKDEEKSRFTDMLLATCKQAQDIEADSILKDGTTDQFKLGHALKYSCISFLQMFQSSEYRINLLASPCRMVDGALVVINYEYGLSSSIVDELRRALKNRIQVMLFINNIDYCFELNGEEVYSILFDIISDVNNIIREHEDGIEVCPVRGTVGFSFGANECAFTLSQCVGENCEVEKLWGENYCDSKMSKWSDMKTKTTQKRGFLHLCYDPIKQILQYGSEDDVQNLCRRSVKLGLKGLEKSDGTTMARRILLHLFPAHSMLIDAIINQLPSPLTAQKHRIQSLYAGDRTDIYGKGITTCDPEAPLMVYTSRKVPDGDNLVLARVFSGKLSTGLKVRVMGNKFVIGKKKDVHTEIVQFRDGKNRDVRSGDLVVIEKSGKWDPLGATITGKEDKMALPFIPPRMLKIQLIQTKSDKDKKVGLIWDERMISGHVPPKAANEVPDRVSKTMAQLRVQGLLERCVTMRPTNPATVEDVALVHKLEYINSVRNICGLSDAKRNKEAAAKFDDLYLSKNSYRTALLAAGAVIEASEKVLKKDLDSAFAIVRPPGHHAEDDTGMGFCIFNNVAVAASVVLNRKDEFKVNRILIVDWDIHFGNGTQKTFLGNTNVLVFNVHRYNDKSFYPCKESGSLSLGVTDKGYNVNVPLEELQYSDDDYMAIWDHVLVPIATSYNPDFILISGGFDAAEGDPLGGCCVTPNGFSLMIRKLLGLAKGRVVISLEGGYDLEALPKSICATVEALLQGKDIAGLSSDYNSSTKISTWQLIQKVCSTYKKHWSTLRYHEGIAELTLKLAVLKEENGNLKSENDSLKGVMRETGNRFLKLSGAQVGEGNVG